jgi:alpha-tubulin suppressor-like RCC1 family protein
LVLLVLSAGVMVLASACGLTPPGSPPTTTSTTTSTVSTSSTSTTITASTTTTAPKPCFHGSFSDTGYPPCHDAPSGYYVDTLGAHTPTPCPLGAYQPLTGQVSCLPAPPGSYVDQVGQWQVTSCPEGTTTTSPGATSASDCVPNPVTQIGAGAFHTCALLPAGTVECWGYNVNGQLGNGVSGSNAYSSIPVAVTGLSGVTQIAVGGGHTCALLSDATVRCWGSNSTGQFGNGSTTGSSTPVPVPGISGVRQIAAGAGFTCVLLTDGTVRCWGNYLYGQLGNGQVAPDQPDVPWWIPTPVVVSGLSGVTQIAAGGEEACALLADGTVRCWGGNGYGDLGDGTDFLRPSPVAVTGLSGVTQLAIGDYHVCALLAVGPSTAGAATPPANWVTGPTRIGGRRLRCPG